MTYKPSRSAPLVYEDAQIKVYQDATWTPQADDAAGWVVHADAVVYAADTGDTRITTAWGHSKVSHVTGPDGTLYKIRDLAKTVVSP
jgi:hypothetical protein